MRLLPLPDGGVRLCFDRDEARLLDQLLVQLIALLQSHSSTALDPDPLFASLEIGGSDSPPSDPALARLFPDAFADATEASAFRRVNEQGLLNRKLQDALAVSSALSLSTHALGDDEATIDADITAATFLPWIRTLTTLRLAIAARLGLEQQSDHDRLLAAEESHGTVMVYDWLAAILDSVLHVMDPE